MPAKWYEIKQRTAPVQGAGAATAEKTVAEIYVYGNIGDRWNEDGVVASEMVRDIAAIDADEITLRINSYGGSVPDGLAIYNALKRHSAPVAVHVDGVAISCASYIAMAGDTITMAKNAQMMIHAPWSFAGGNAVELREQAEILDRYAKAMASAYADKSGRPYADALAILTDGKDHWYSADEALQEGFADAVGEEISVAASLASSFDLSRFKPAAPAASGKQPQAALAPRFAISERVTIVNPHDPKHSVGEIVSVSAEPVYGVAIDGMEGMGMHRWYTDSEMEPEDNKSGDSMNMRSHHQPAAAAVTPKEASMPASVNAAGQPAATPFARTKDDNARVVAMFKPYAASPEIAALQTEVLADPELTIESIQSRLLTEVGKGITPANPSGAHPVVQTVADEVDKQRAAAVSALMVRAGVEQDAKVKASMTSNPFRGHKLLDLARASLARTGTKTDGMSQMDIVAAAFTQGTSDFPVLLENTMHKALQASYARAALTWNRFCATGSVGDFRAHNRYRTGSFGTLDAVNELGEFTNKSIPDGEKGSIQAATKGNIINLSRTAIINDDLAAFVGLSGMLGRAAARTVEVDVYALLALNAGLGPVMGDGKTLFHADHKNITTGAALSMAAIDADRVAMASQMDVSGNDFLDLRPAVLLVPIGLGGTARSINDAQYDPDTANKLQKPNVVNGLFRDIVDTPRLTGTRRYAFADATEAPVLEVAFLDGASDPYLEVQDGFDVDGARYKVRLDYGVAATDYRGAITNAGV